MGLGIPFPKIDGKALAVSLVLRQARRRMEDFLDQIGPERLKWMVENDKDFAQFLPPGAGLGAGESSLFAKLSFVTDDQIAKLAPPWAKQIVDSQGEKGQAWLKRNVAWIRGMVGKGGGQLG